MTASPSTSSMRDITSGASVTPEAATLEVTCSGRLAPMTSEVDGVGASLTIRSVPLAVAGERLGSLLLVSDVSEIRRQERELLTKDATIR